MAEWSPEMKEWLKEKGFLPKDEKEAELRKNARDYRDRSMHMACTAYYRSLEEEFKPIEPPDFVWMQEVEKQIMTKFGVELALLRNTLNEHIDLTTKRKQAKPKSNSQDVYL